MGSTTIWTVSMTGLLASVAFGTIEESMRRRASCLRLQHELRGDYRSKRSLCPVLDLLVVPVADRGAS